MRRTPLFQELLFTMVNSSNPHNYGKDLRYKYRFAVLNEVRELNVVRLYVVYMQSSFVSTTLKESWTLSIVA